MVEFVQGDSSGGGGGSIPTFEGTITGDGVTKNFTITHNLNDNVISEVVETFGSFRKIYPITVKINSNQIQIQFLNAPAIGENYLVPCVKV